MKRTILIVDDDPTQRRLLELALGDKGYDTRQMASGEEALAFLQSGEALDIDLVLLDIVMPDVSGIDVLEKIHPLHPTLPIVMLTAHGSVNLVVKAMRAGSVDFVVKPTSPERLKVSIENALKLNALTGEVTRLSRRDTGTLRFDDIIGGGAAICEAIEIAKKAAQSDVSVMIEGESGVGKELFARAIQSSGDRAGKPFIVVNCGALPENLVESILFGHEKGAFTGAIERHPGKFQDANGGTIFLDEIGELKPHIQVKLLRALQEREVDPVGGTAPMDVDIRLISATNKKLSELVKSGEFREDLFYRLNVFPLRVPPLRERKEDIPELVDHFIKRIAAAEGRAVHAISQSALDLFRDFHWPGNARQLENVIFRAIVLCDHEIMTETDFPQILSAVHPSRAGDLSVEADLSGLSATPGAPNGTGGLTSLGAVPVVDAGGDMRQIRDIEAEVIEFAMHKYRGRMSEIARRLGIGRSTLYRKISDIGLDVNDLRA